MKSYYDIAVNDYHYLESCVQRGDSYYNNLSVQCQQIAEKMLKHIIMLAYTGSDRESLLKSHNLKKIYYAIRSCMPSFELDPLKLANLTDYYFEPRYPGDDYIDVTREMFDVCYSTMLEVKNVVERFI